jgi:uncharacterized protein (UPF0305 family)
MKSPEFQSFMAKNILMLVQIRIQSSPLRPETKKYLIKEVPTILNKIQTLQKDQDEQSSEEEEEEEIDTSKEEEE